jgi:hypothetical protein
MNGVDFSLGRERSEPETGDAGDALHGLGGGPEEPGVAAEKAFVRAWRLSRDAGRKFGALAKSRPWLAVGIAAGSGVAAGVLVGTRMARLALLLAAGYAMHNMRGSGEPLLKAGVDRLARVIAG